MMVGFDIKVAFFNVLFISLCLFKSSNGLFLLSIVIMVELKRLIIYKSNSLNKVLSKIKL